MSHGRRLTLVLVTTFYDGVKGEMNTVGGGEVGEVVCMEGGS